MGEAGGTQQNLLGGMFFNKIWFHLWSKKLNYGYETNYKMCISNTSPYCQEYLKKTKENFSMGDGLSLWFSDLGMHLQAPWSC